MKINTPFDTFNSFHENVDEVVDYGDALHWTSIYMLHSID